LLRVVLRNLIGNAWKFTAKSATARIEFGSIDSGARLTTHESCIYFVRDNGVGFDMAKADKLFTAFQRLHNVREYPGTGIGLATVQRIVQRHGGRVWAEAAVGKGATFYFTL
jgi:signal transduction histidine kinase